MARKIFRNGNSMVVSLPRNLLGPLNLVEGSEVVIELDREKGCLTLMPFRLELKCVDAEYSRRIDAFVTQYRSSLEELAKR